MAAGSRIATRLETHRQAEYPGSKAVLTAIAIPVFTTQLEKARESTDLANIRSAYAEVVVDAIEDNAAASKEVKLKQTVGDWQTTDATQTLADICGDASYVTGTPSNGGKI